MSTRFNYQNPFLFGDYIGTNELDGNLSHFHEEGTTHSIVTSLAGGGGNNAANDGHDAPIPNAGGAESTPRNFYVNTAIIY